MRWPTGARWPPRIAEKPPDPLPAGDPGTRLKILQGEEDEGGRGEGERAGGRPGAGAGGPGHR